jgi:hypothetical protein
MHVRRVVATMPARGAAIILLIGAVTANAALGRSVTRRTPEARSAAATARDGVAVSKNVNFAGYQLNGGGQLASFNLTARFTVPKLTCRSATTGIAPFIYVGNTQVGTFVGCAGGKSHYFPFIELNGHRTNYTSVAFKPGDTVALHLVDGPKSASVSVTDITRKITKKKAGAGQKGLGFPGIGDGSWIVNGHELGVPDFGTLGFDRCTQDGRPLGSGGSPSAPAVIRYDRVNSHGVLQIQTSALASNLEKFHTVFKNS